MHSFCNFGGDGQYTPIKNTLVQDDAAKLFCFFEAKTLKLLHLGKKTASQMHVEPQIAVHC